MWTHSYIEGHLQVLTHKVIDRGSIKKMFNLSLQPLGIFVIHSEAKVINRTFGYKKCNRLHVLGKCVLYLFFWKLFFIFILFFTFHLLSYTIIKEFYFH
jgi:hypothetical protein